MTTEMKNLTEGLEDKAEQKSRKNKDLGGEQ